MPAWRACEAGYSVGVVGGSSMAFFTLTGGVDHFTGIANELNTFSFTASTLQSSDTITGAGISDPDILVLTAAGTITATQFAGVTNVDQLNLPDGTNVVTLANNLVAGSAAFNVNGGSGGDTIDGSTINNGVILRISSGAGTDTLKGGSAGDFLDGQAGDDTMIGGAGSDIYYVDSTGDVIVENPGEGNDVVQAAADYTLPANVDSIGLLECAGNINAAGNGDPNALSGNSGNNTLDGKGGDDTMHGGAGNDVYFVDSTSDVVQENAGEGNDIVYASVDYTLPANVDSIVLIEGAGNINAAGNGDANALVGNSGNNTLDG